MGRSREHRRRTKPLTEPHPPISEEAERLYQQALRLHTAAAIEDAVSFLTQTGTLLDAGDLDRGYDLAVRIQELRSLTPQT